MIEEATKAFETTYKDMAVVKAIPYKDNMVFIFAKNRNNKMALDPFFLYDQESKDFLVYQPTANLKEFNEIMQKISPREGANS